MRPSSACCSRTSLLLQRRCRRSSRGGAPGALCGGEVQGTAKDPLSPHPSIVTVATTGGPGRLSSSALGSSVAVEEARRDPAATTGPDAPLLQFDLTGAGSWRLEDGGRGRIKCRFGGAGYHWPWTTPNLKEMGGHRYFVVLLHKTAAALFTWKTYRRKTLATFYRRRRCGWCNVAACALPHATPRRVERGEVLRAGALVRRRQAAAWCRPGAGNTRRGWSLVQTGCREHTSRMDSIRWSTGGRSSGTSPSPPPGILLYSRRHSFVTSRSRSGSGVGFFLSFVVKSLVKLVSFISRALGFPLSRFVYLCSLLLTKNVLST
jgi:hypothetical protein